jgi:hypothetical protein
MGFKETISGSGFIKSRILPVLRLKTTNAVYQKIFFLKFSLPNHYFHKLFVHSKTKMAMHKI